MITVNQNETKAQILASRLTVISKRDSDLLLEISKWEQQAKTPEDFKVLEEKIKEFKSGFVLSEDEWENGVTSNMEVETDEIFETGEVESLPTKWFKTEQISTWIGPSLSEAKTLGSIGGHGLLMIQHQCGENKEALIGQLNTMIYRVENGPDMFTN